eukprot:10115307-Alexandrium_andersonii.AAC.1
MRAPPRAAEGAAHRRPKGPPARLRRRRRVRGLAPGGGRARQVREARSEPVRDSGGALPLGSPLHDDAGGLRL